ncbi:MAG: twin-arginine translocase TatA/TatE family subunit [Proteobacteria bacterium]|nr:twin-arginine translocase TatA/TatE family subunit [Pseudomonadota bacterium]
MFGIGLTEIIMIMGVALLVIGPDKLPELAKTLGKALAEFKKVVDGVKTSIDGEPTRHAAVEEESAKKPLDDREEELMREYEDTSSEDEDRKDKD